MKIAILVPTRNRPQSMQRLVDSLLTTSSVMPEVVAYVDDDDSSIEEVRKIQEVKVITGPRQILSGYWNTCLLHTDAEILMQCGDDVVFRTKGWDDIVLSTFASYPDKLIFVHGSDGYQPNTFGTHGFLHRNWINAVGYFSPPYFVSDYGDTWNNDIANAIGRRVHIPIMTEHMHPVAGKAEWDQTHKERLARERDQNPGFLYSQLAHERSSNADKLRKIINS